MNAELAAIVALAAAARHRREQTRESLVALIEDERAVAMIA